MQVRFLGQEDPLEEEMASHSSILAWRIPRTEEPGGLQSVGSQTVGHNWSDLAHTHYLKTLNLVWFYFLFLTLGFFFSSSGKIVCLLSKHQNYCVSLLWRQVSTILTLIPCMPLCTWHVSFISTFILGAIQTLTSLSVHKNLVKQFVAVCELYLKKMRSFLKRKEIGQTFTTASISLNTCYVRSPVLMWKRVKMCQAWDPRAQGSLFQKSSLVSTGVINVCPKCEWIALNWKL